MSAAHIRRVIDNIGKARLVQDKPYAIQNLLEACNQVWKAESRAEAGKLDWLELIGWMWDKTRVKWTKKKPKGSSRWIAAICGEHPCKMRLVFQSIYERKDADGAKKLFRNQCARVLPLQGKTGKLLILVAQFTPMIECTGKRLGPID